MKYYNPQAVASNPNIVRTGKIVYADKFSSRDNSHGFAFIKCNGRRVYVPYNNLSEDVIKRFYVSCAVEFTLDTDGERVWANSVVIKDTRPRHATLFGRDSDLELYIPVKTIKKIDIQNQYFSLSKELQRESDNRRINRNLYNCIVITTIKDVYHIFSKTSPIKGDRQVDDLIETMKNIYSYLELGNYEEKETDISYFKRIKENEEEKEIRKNLKELLKTRISINSKVTDSESGETRYIIKVDEGYSVSYSSETIHTDKDEAEYNGLTLEEYIVIAKEHSGVTEGEYTFFSTQNNALGFVRALILENIIRFGIREE